MHEKKKINPISDDTSKDQIRNIGYPLWRVDTWPCRHHNYVKGTGSLGKRNGRIKSEFKHKNSKEIMDNTHWMFSST